MTILLFNVKHISNITQIIQNHNSYIHVHTLQFLQTSGQTLASLNWHSLLGNKARVHLKLCYYEFATKQVIIWYMVKILWYIVVFLVHISAMNISLDWYPVFQMKIKLCPFSCRSTEYNISTVRLHRNTFPLCSLSNKHGRKSNSYFSSFLFWNIVFKISSLF